MEPLFAYLTIASKQASDINLAGAYNIGPNDCDCITTGRLVELFAQKWGDEFNWIDGSEPSAPHEATYLKLNSEKMKKTFGWQPHWNVENAVDATIDWAKCYASDGDIVSEMGRQMNDYLTI